MTSVLITALLFASGCGEEAPPEPTAEELAAKAKAKAEAASKAKAKAEAAAKAAEEATKAPETGLEGARHQAQSGDHAKALETIQAALADAAGEEEAWRLLVLCALSTDGAGAALDALDASTPVGGQALQHFRARAELALAAERAADAWNAAEAIAEVDAIEGAAWKVRALAAGAEAPDPKGLDKESAADALVLAQVSGRRGKAPLAKAVFDGPWRAVAVRAELHAAAGDDEAALADRQAVLGAGDPLAVRAVAPMLAEAAEDPGARGDLQAQLARAHAELAMGADAAVAASAAVAAYIEAQRYDDALAIAKEIHTGRTEAEDQLGAAHSGTALATIALLKGGLQTAVAEARTAALAFHELGDADAAADASWLQALAAFGLGLDEELASAQEKAGDRAALVEGLRNLTVGNSLEAMNTLRAHGLDGHHGVLLDLAAAAAAEAADEPALSAANAAVTRADRAGWLPDRVLARLEAERIAADSGDDARARVLRGELAGLADELAEAGGPLRAEVAARSIMAGDETEIPAGWSDDASGGWAALAQGVSAEGEHPVALWASARALASQGDWDGAHGAYAAAVRATPVDRQGPWASLLSQDGSRGPGVEIDAELLREADTSASALALLEVHEWWHAAAQTEMAFHVGDDPSLGLELDQRMSLNEAHAAVRAEQLAWLVGAGEGAGAAEERLARLQEQAAAVAAYARAVPTIDFDIEEIRKDMKGQVILSYRLGPDTGDMVLVTAGSAHAYTLDDTPSIVRNARAVRSELLVGEAQGGSKVNPLPGDAIRAALIDPTLEHLQGIGRYLILPDGPLWGFNFGALPEQKQGRRFLADIRSIGSQATVTEAFVSRGAPPTSFNPDFLGITPEGESIGEGGLARPSEVQFASRHFGADFREVFDEDAATAAELVKWAPSARYLHLSDVPSGERGSLLFRDDEVSLHTLRGLGFTGQVAILSVEMSPKVAARRAQALRAGGFDSVIYTTWLVDQTVRSKMLYSFYDARNRDRTPARAIAEARQILLDDGLRSYFDPSWWGAYTLAGLP